jgi:hypothetical protein
MLDIVDERIETATCSTCSGSTFSTTSSESDDSDYLPQIAQLRGQLKHSAAVQALPQSHTDPAEGEGAKARASASMDEAMGSYSIFEENIVVRPPWTPPPSPSIASVLVSDAPTQLMVPDIEGRRSVYPTPQVGPELTSSQPSFTEEQSISAGYGVCLDPLRQPGQRIERPSGT